MNIYQKKFYIIEVVLDKILKNIKYKSKKK